MNQELVQAIQSEIEQSRSEGCSDEDVKWMAIGAGLRLVREQGIISEVSPEMEAAIEAVVSKVLSHDR